MNSEDEVMTVSCAIIDSLSGLVGKRVTPELLETVKEICASHLRERGLPEISISEILNRMAGRGNLPEQY